ncbi:MAG: hypothetical protein RLZZ393_2083 [Pseudomonadota bacterium]|jgi:protocatechuate 3,4-dioxygenase beta subunit
MRSLFLWAMLMASPALAVAAPPSTMDFDIRVNLADRREVHRMTTLADLASQRVSMEDGLGVELQIKAPAWGGRWIDALLLGAGDRRLTLMDWPFRLDPPWPVLHLAFSVCGDRIIALRDAAPGRCADLLPMAKPDPLLGDCGPEGFRCLGVYEGLPAKIGSHSRIAPRSEPGVPLTLTGRVLDAAGKPSAGVIIYGYQTDRTGEYPAPSPPRSALSNYHGRLRGWVRSDAQGRYRFDTILPGSYGGNPAHIHMNVIEPGCGTYYIDDLMFEGDESLVRLTAAQRSLELKGLGGSGVGTLVRQGKGWTVTRDVHLGENVAGYVPCTSPPRP